ncbi:MAG TPA: cytochrome c oxidase subunit II [Thermodesulfobacteriota bacterium]|nr:cytochrome c oxidase subunit II [Thermodesulfobacteriota bacterium]
MTWIPEVASNLAGKVDGVLLLITLMSLVFFILITVVLVYFAIKYRRRREDEETPYITGSEPLEIIWTVIPSILLIVLFVYGYVVYKEMRTPPKDAIDIGVQAKQWLWTFDYYNGKKTINELYVQQNRPVRLVMQSDDVLHDLFIPAFRMKQDVLPGRYVQQWFTPTKIGTFDIFCAEYCGTGHSAMLAKIVVLSPEAYEIWDKGVKTVEGAGVASLPPAELGEKLYKEKGCNACHSVDGSKIVGPSFKGIYGHTVELQDGSTVDVDENYIRESILEPQTQVVKGFQPVMPSFKGILSDEDITSLIAYIKTLK